MLRACYDIHTTMNTTATFFFEFFLKTKTQKINGRLKSLSVSFESITTTTTTTTTTTISGMLKRFFNERNSKK